MTNDIALAKSLVALLANPCRSGGGMGAGQAEKSFSNPTAPRRLAGFGVSTMLFLPSRMGRTSTIPPRDKPEESRHHLGRVPRPALETVIVSKSFTFYGFLKSGNCQPGKWRKAEG
jgi:hypothetical protein